MLQLLASGLQFWIRQQCQTVGGLELQLQGSALGLLRGRLEAVCLTARRVVFNDLEIEQVDLRSDAIQVQLGNVLKGQPLQLDHPFSIAGTVAFSGAGLSRSLCKPGWRALADQLSDGLMGLTPLQDLRIERDRLVLTAQGRSCNSLPCAEAGCLALLHENGQAKVVLPGDPNITIESASLEGGLLQLQGRARVSP